MNASVFNALLVIDRARQKGKKKRDPAAIFVLFTLFFLFSIYQVNGVTSGHTAYAGSRNLDLAQRFH